MADSWRRAALGFAAAADAQLAEPAAGLRLRRRRSRRLHDDAGGGRLHLAASPTCRPPRCGRTPRSRRSRRMDAGYRVVTDQRRVPLPHRGAGERRLQRAERAGRLRRGAALGRVCHAARLSQPEPAADGGVLVVGASATGVQLADEIHRSGRPVTLSVGEHVRLPRTYRGRDVLWWMDASGRVEPALRRDRRPGPRARAAVTAAGRHARTDHAGPQRALGAAAWSWLGGWSAVRDGRALFSGGLRNQFALADLKMERLLDTFDEWARTSGSDDRRRARRALRAHAHACVVAAESRSAER